MLGAVIEDRWIHNTPICVLHVVLTLIISRVQVVRRIELSLVEERAASATHGRQGISLCCGTGNMVSKHRVSTAWSSMVL